MILVLCNLELSLAVPGLKLVSISYMVKICTGNDVVNMCSTYVSQILIKLVYVGVRVSGAACMSVSNTV